MKTPLKTLRGFAATRHERKERRIRSLTQADELAQATQDMVDMRDCYDGLLSAAAATANSAYEFSESLQEMGECILEKTSLSDDEETGKVLLMLGKVQFQFHKLLDSYRSHINQTITVPSESLLNELNVVEDMKRQCDEKRESYDQLIKKYTEKGNLRGAKGECFSSHQLQAAYDEYDEGANVFVLRMKSLRQGQSRSLLTQAARHHAAQVPFLC
nr:Arfaptin homology (AH) domain/BAR domain-containing protein [Ipomoea batatas]